MREELVISTFFNIIVSMLTLAYILLMGYPDAFNTLALLVLGSIILTYISKQINIKDLKFIHLLLTIFSIRLLLLIIIYHMGWRATLASGNSVSGYDPQRYYYQAIELIENKYIFASGINYAGIIYWYAFLLQIFGRSPIVPIIMNNLFTSITALLLVRLISVDSLIGLNKKKIKNYCLLFLFIPELIWYDTLSSRESLCMFLFFTSVFTIYRIIEDKINIARVVSFIMTVLLIGVIRMSLLFPLIGISIFIALLSKGLLANQFRKILFFIILIVGIIIVPILGSMIGSNNVSYSNLLSDTFSRNDFNVDNYTWSNNSIGKLLIPGSPLEMAFLAPIRMIVYLIVPLPNFSIDFPGLLISKYSAWQGLFVLFSSIIYVLKMPDLFAAVIGLFSKKLHQVVGNKSKIITICMLIVVLTVSSGTKIIHERYRVIIIPWIILTLIVGRHTNARIQRTSQLISILGIIAIVSLYVFLKV